MASLDLAMDAPVQKERELADTFDALARLEDAVTLAPAILTADHVVADWTERAGAVIIRGARLTRARNLNDRSGGGAEETGAGTSATQEIRAISEAMEVLRYARYHQEHTRQVEPALRRNEPPAGQAATRPSAISR
jgi:hypothetical protein